MSRSSRIPLGRAVVCAAVMLLLAGRPHASTADVLVEGDLPRQANLGFEAGSSEGLLLVTELEAGSPDAQAGLQRGDAIVSINRRTFAKPHVGLDLLEKLDGGIPVELGVTRDGRREVVRFTPPPRPFEKLAGLDAIHGVVDAPDGARLRTILTRPSGTTEPLPAVFFVQWVGCDTVQFYGDGPWVVLFRTLAERSGLVMIRMERSANGDSEGPGCHALDYDTELAHYRHVYDVMSRHPWVDANRIIIVGNSLGSSLAPLVAAGRKVAGVAITAGGGLSYFERMVAFDRLQLSRPGRDPAALHDALIRQIRFQTHYLLERQSPEQIEREHPDLSGVWPTIVGTDDGVHYGRPYAFHQQAAAKNLLGAWSGIEAPVLVVHNEYDQYETLRGAEVVVEMANRLRPGSAELVVMPRLNHSFYRYPTRDAALAGAREGREPAGEEAARIVLDWLDRIVKAAAGPHGARLIANQGRPLQS